MVNQLERCYRELGLQPSATFREVRRAYRSLVRVWHPDQFARDPRQQMRAQERLKQINEAYRLIKEHLAAGPPPVEAAPAPEAAPPAPPPRPAPPRKARPSSPPLPTVTVFPFFTAWENGLFLLLVAAVFYFINARYPTLGAGAAHALRLLLVPLILSLLCNSRWGGWRIAWRIYVAVTLLCGGWLLADLVSFANDVQQEVQTPYPYEPGGGGGFTIPRGEAPAPFYVPGRQAPSGPLAPAAPAVPAPAAPLAPVAPAAPVVAPAR